VICPDTRPRFHARPILILDGKICPFVISIGAAYG
jgi:hypothetical protein